MPTKRDIVSICFMLYFFKLLFNILEKLQNEPKKLVKITMAKKQSGQRRYFEIGTRTKGFIQSPLNFGPSIPHWCSLAL